MIDVNHPKRMKELFEGERVAKTDAGGQAAGDRDSAGAPRKKTVPPGQKRQVGKIFGSVPVFDACSVPVLSSVPFQLCISGQASGWLANETESGRKAFVTAIRQGGAIRRSRSCVVEGRRLAGGETSGATSAT